MHLSQPNPAHHLALAARLGIVHLVLAACVLFLGCSQTCLAQTATFEWAQFLTGPSHNNSLIGVDSAGNLIAGAYEGGWHPPGTIVPHVFLKVDPEGNEVWNHGVLIFPESMAAAPGGSMYVIGNLRKAGIVRDIPPDYFSNLGIPGSGASSAYLGKLNSSGALEWVRFIGDSMHIESRAVRVLPTGEYYIAGVYRAEPVKVGDVSLPAPPSTDTANVFLAKFGADGRVIWAHAGEILTWNLGIRTMVLDESGNVFLDFPGAEFSFQGGTRKAAGAALFSADGEPLWMPSQQLDRWLPIAVTWLPMTLAPDGSIFVVRADSTNLGRNKSRIWIERHTLQRGVQWTRAVDLASNDPVVHDLIVDSSGHCFVLGRFGAFSTSNRITPAEIRFGPNASVSTTAKTDFWIVRYGPSGDVRWAVQSKGEEPLWIGDPPSLPSLVSSSSLAVDSSGGVYVVATILGPVAFGETTLTGWAPPDGHAVVAARITDPDALRPALRVERDDGRLRLSWPASAAGFLIEGTVDASSAVWVAVPGIPVIEGDQHVVRVTPEESARFFRLRKP